MINFVYDPNDYKENTYTILPEGDHRVRIAEVNERTFSSGNEGFEIILDVSGYSNKLWYYLVLNTSDAQKTNQKLGSFFNCFGITNYALNAYTQWVGKVGAARVKHEEYNGKPSAKVQYLISKSKQDTLPPWKGNVAPAAVNTDANGFVEVDEDELPFN